ncbi:MAG: hypothetical protein IJM37_09045 [Lachnospiraceae bacterium]|nr:hypothetical protein [Lachnospiraceae bacterium]
MKIKKVLSVLLTLALVLSILPELGFTKAVSDSIDASSKAEAAGYGIEQLGSVVASMDTSSGSVSLNNLTLIQSGISDCEYTYQWISGKYAVNMTGFAYFTANRGAISNSDRNLIVEITYYDKGLGSLNMQYNSTSADYTLKQVQLTNTNTWQKTIIVIDNAQFAYRQNAGADFRVNGAPISTIKFAKGTLNPANEATVNVSASSYSEFKGKTVAGYQAWFTATEGREWNRTFDIYPNVEDYDQSQLAHSSYSNLGNGEPALLFSSNNANTINTHFSWMQQYGIDGAAVQRFSPNITGRNIILNKEGSHLYKIKQAAEQTNRIFYIMYDISGGVESSYVEDMKFDWVYNIEQSLDLLHSPSYATVTKNGVTKPVVCIWGLGVEGRPTSGYNDMIDFFHSRGCYVIVGTSTNWRGEQYLNSYLKADMISPWAVGTYGDKNGINNKVNNTYAADIAYLNSRGIDFYPVVWSGFTWCLWNNGRPNMIPRNAGQFIWDQFYSLKQNLGTNAVYIAMFDEYDEGTAIAKNATDYFEIPTDRFYVTSSIDGYWLSSDFQLRVCQSAINMIKGNSTLRETCDVAHSTGPIYYRNSFEKKYVTCKETQYNGIYNVDPCFKNEGVVTTSNASISASIEQASAKTGSYVARVTGNAGSNSSNAVYRISECAINVTSGMKLSYSINPANSAGRYAYVDLLCSDGTYISSKGYSTNGTAMGTSAKGNVGSWTDYTFTFGDSQTVGKKIVAVVLRQSGASGSYTASFDNVIISDNGGNTPVVETVTVTFKNGNNTVESYTINKGASISAFPEIAAEDGKIFAGWYTQNVTLNSVSAVNSAANKVATLGAVNENKTYYAGWINIGTVSKDAKDSYASGSTVSEFELMGVQVRITNPSGLRFITRISDKLVGEIQALNGSNASLRPSSANAKGIGYGTVTILASKLNGTLVKDESATTVAKGAVVCPAVSNFMDYDGYVLYTCVVKGIPVKNYKSDIAARPYITYKDANGTTRTYYITEVGTASAGGGYKTSIYNAAQAMINTAGTDAATRSWLQTNIINAAN